MLGNTRIIHEDPPGHVTVGMLVRHDRLKKKTTGSGLACTVYTHGLRKKVRKTAFSGADRTRIDFNLGSQ